MLVGVYTEREDRIRIISARTASAKNGGSMSQQMNRYDA